MNEFQALRQNSTVAAQEQDAMSDIDFESDEEMDDGEEDAQPSKKRKA
jgi:hypothetical protein